MRLLFLLQGKTIKDQPGYDDGFKRLLSEQVLKAYRVLPYYGYIERYGYEEFYRHAFSVAAEMAAEAVFLQFPHGLEESPARFLKRVRRLPNQPTIFTSNGDPYGTFLHPPPPGLVASAKQSDITFTTAMGTLARQIKRHGVRNIVLMPHGYCQVRFGKKKPPTADQRDFDIVFVGSLTKPRNPLKFYYRAMRHRKKMVDLLSRRYGSRFAVFGHGWQKNRCWQGPIPFQDQEKTYQRSRIVFGGFPGATTDYYNSDRPFISAVSGVPLVDYRVPKVDRFLAEKRHWFLFRTRREMVSLFDELLSKDERSLREVGDAARKLCMNRHSHYHRTRAMVEIAAQVRRADLSGLPPPLPPLDYFHDDVMLEDEYPFAVCNWAAKKNTSCISA